MISLFDLWSERVTVQRRLPDSPLDRTSLLRLSRANDMAILGQPILEELIIG